MKSRNIFLFTVFMFVSFKSFAGLLFNYSELALKDLDQMGKLVKSKMAESKKSGGNKAIPLKEALQAVYSRSNEDFMIEKVIPPLRMQLEELDAWESSMKALTKEAIGALNNPRAFKPVVQVTYQIFLENLMAELKPRALESFEKSVLEQIRDAKIEPSKELVQERKLRIMKETISASEIAKKILIDAEKAEADRIEAEKAEAAKSENQKSETQKDEASKSEAQK